MAVEYRKESVAAQRATSSLGTIAIAAPPARWIYVSLAAAILFAITLIATFGGYTRRESVVGRLVPASGLITLQASQAGILASRSVREGEHVAKGQVLAELREPQDGSRLGDVHAVVASQIENQRIRLESDVSNAHRQATDQRSALRDRIALLDQQVVRTGGQIELQKKKAEASARLADRMRPANQRGVISDVQFAQQEASALDDRTQIGVLERQRLDLMAQAVQARQQLAEVDTTEHTSESNIARQLADIDKSLVENEGKHATLLRSPVDGIVSAAILQPGEAVSAGQTLLTILPDGSHMEAQFLVPSRAIGLMRAGDAMALRYRAYPYQRFGQFVGHVTGISRTSLSKAEANALGNDGQDPEAMYRVQVALAAESIQVYGKAETFLPGMMVDADVLVERRSLFEWVFEPLYGVREKLGRSVPHG
jgi:membrane fusion protein